jgi:hypothetical protein
LHLILRCVKLLKIAACRRPTTIESAGVAKAHPPRRDSESRFVAAPRQPTVEAGGG